MMKLKQLKGAVLTALAALVSLGANAEPVAAGCYTITWFDANGAFLRTHVLTLGRDRLVHDGAEPRRLGSWRKVNDVVQIQEFLRIEETWPLLKTTMDIRSYWLKPNNPGHQMSGKVFYHYDYANWADDIYIKINDVYDVQWLYTPDDPYCVR